MSDDTVGVSVTVVPDGVQPSGAYRLSLVLSAVFDCVSGLTVDFRQWPSEIARVLRDGEVKVYLDGSDKEFWATPDRVEDVDAAARLWTRLLFPRGGTTAAVAHGLAQQKQARDIAIAQIVDPDGARVRVISSAPHGLARMVRAVQAADALYGLAVQRGAPTVSVPPGKRLLGSEALRAKEPSTPARAANLAAGRANMVASLGDQFAIGERLRTHVAETPGQAPQSKGTAADVLTPDFVVNLATAYSNALTRSGKAYRENAFRSADTPLAPKPFGRVSRDISVLDASRLDDKNTVKAVNTQFAALKASKRVAPPQPPDAASTGRYNRKLAGIMANPSLAKFLHLIVDIEVPRAVFAGFVPPVGTVAVVLALGGDETTRCWSAFGHAAPHTSDGYFGPVSRAAWATNGHLKDSQLRYVKGVQNLGFVGEDGFRFQLESVDADALVHATETASRAIQEEHNEGEPAQAINQALPHARTLGISLVDLLRQDRVAQSLNKPPHLGDPDQPLAAEELAIGYRVDVNWTVDPPPGQHAYWRGWRSLMERVVTLGDDELDRALKTFQSGLPAYDRAREAGLVRTPVRVDSYQVDPVPGGHPTENHSLGTPPIEGLEPASHQPPPGGLGQAPPPGTTPGPAGQQPPDIGETGIPPPADGSPGTAPITALIVRSHRPPETAGPGTHPPDSDDLGVPPRQLTDAIAHDTMVTWRGWSLAAPALRPDGPTPVDPDKDLAVDVTYQLPSGPGAPRMWPLRFGRSYRMGVRLVWLNGSGPTPASAHRLYETSPHLILGATADDALHAGADHGFAFRRQEPVPAPDVLLLPYAAAIPALTNGEQTQTLVVRSNNSGRADAGPDVDTISERAMVPSAIVEELAAMHGVFDRTPEVKPAGGLRHVVRCGAHSFPWLDGGTLMCEADGTPDLDAQPDQRSVLVYRSQPHTEQPFWPDPMAADLHWAFMRGDVVAPGYPAPGKVSFYARNAAWPDASAVRLRLHSGKPGTAARVEAHAPARRRVTSLGTSLEVTEAVLDVYLPPGETVDLLVWCHNSDHTRLYQHAAPGLLAAYAAQCGDTGLPEDLRQDVCSFHDHICTSAASGNAAAEAHCIEALLEQRPLPLLAASRRLTLVHAVTRPVAGPAELQPLIACPRQAGEAAVLLDGTLTIHRPSTSAVELQASWDEYADADGLPSVPVTQAATITLDTPDADSQAPLRLGTDDRGLQRKPVLRLPDTRARLVQVVPVARSRYATLFTPASPSPATFRAPGQTGEPLLIPATARPSAPVLLADGVTLTVRHDRPLQAPGTFVLEQRVIARLLMPRGWYSSGFGELLAVLIGPDSRDTANIVALGSYLTQWGADPTRSGPALASYALSADRFRRWTAKDTLALPLPSGTSTAAVTALGYAPQYDRQRGTWTVDIGIDAGGSPDAFVRLGLARYQPNALPGYELSVPISAWVAGLKPARTVRVVVTGRTAMVEVSGMATRQTRTQAADTPWSGNPMERAAGLRAGTDVPLMTVRLMRGMPGRAPAPVADPLSGAPIERHVPGAPDGQATRWCTTLPMPPDWQRHGYAVQVEEREWLAADDRATGGTVLAERGSPFHALILLEQS
jgi:hypothetical protein